MTTTLLTVLFLGVAQLQHDPEYEPGPGNWLVYSGVNEMDDTPRLLMSLPSDEGAALVVGCLGGWPSVTLSLTKPAVVPTARPHDGLPIRIRLDQLPPTSETWQVADNLERDILVAPEPHRFASFLTAPKRLLVEYATTSGYRDILHFSPGGWRELYPRFLEACPEVRQEAETPERQGPPDCTKPVKISGAEAEYPELAKKSRKTGAVLFQAIVDERGRVADVNILMAPNYPGFAESVEEAVATWEFTPARCDGEPVSVYFNGRVDFDLGRKKKRRK